MCFYTARVIEYIQVTDAGIQGPANTSTIEVEAIENTVYTSFFQLQSNLHRVPNRSGDTQKSLRL